MTTLPPSHNEARIVPILTQHCQDQKAITVLVAVI